MSSQDSWSCLSVEKFLSLCNWEGQKKRGGAAKKQNSWQCLSVQEFFRHCNWQGQPLENRNWHERERASFLKEQVSEFFQFIPWEGNPEIGFLPKVSPIPELIPKARLETTFTDLSELF